jgi:hypothetical protein
LFLVLSPLPARAVAWNNDCGSGGDTGPSTYSIHIPSGGACSGSMDGESYSFAGWGCSFVCAMDSYTFDATIDDYVTIGFSSTCAHWNVSSGGGGTHTGSFVAPSTGTFGLRAVAESGFDGGGCYGSTNYNISVKVVPNTRPTVSIISAPGTAYPADTVSFTTAGTDPEHNLSRLGVTVHPVSTTTWQTPDATGRTTFSMSFGANATLDFIADDTYGAAATPVTHAITLVENDCSTGADVTLISMPFPFTCHAHLAPSLGDNQDSFTFEVPAGTARVAAGLARRSGQLQRRMVLTSPSGATYTGPLNGNLYVPAEEGTWRLDANRITAVSSGVDTSYGGYDLNVRAIGPLDMPSVSASVSISSPHWWEPFTLTFSAIDPNNLPVWYSVNWGDGSTTERVPATGLVPSGTVKQLSHEYASSQTGARTIIVTATSDDGTSAAATVPISVLAPDDRCGIDTTAAADSPPSNTAFPNPKFEHDFTQASESWLCNGEVGYTVSKSGSTSTVDAVDTYRFAMGCLTDACGGPGTPTGSAVTSRMRVTLRTGAALGATMRLGFGGIYQVVSATAGPNGTATITLPVFQPVLRWYADVTATSGRGAYTLEVEALPPV